MHAGDTDRPAASPEPAAAAPPPGYTTGFQSLPMITSTSVSYS